MNLSRK
jgi:hypothetical protein